MTNPCDITCPKCGSADVWRVFVPRGAKVETKEYDRRPNKWTTGQCWSYTADRDYINHHCRCCQYDWQGKPLAPKKRAANTSSTEPT